MNIIVVGCGRVGSQLAMMLSVEGNNVVVIDRSESAFGRLGSTFNGVTIVGMGFDEETLEEAGIHEADAFVATTDLDNTNLMACEVARKIFGVPHTVARLYNPFRERTYQQLDLDYVCGTTLVAEHLLEKVKSGHGHHRETIDDIEVVEFKASAWCEGKTVSQLDLPREFRIFTITRTRGSLIPESDTVVHHGDVMFGAVKNGAFDKIERYMED